MKLFVVRHGIAIDRKAPDCPPDPERFLTEDGVKKTAQVAKAVATLGEKADLLISSPYVRATQTAEIFAASLGHAEGKIRRSETLLPGTDPLLLFRELAKEKETDSVFVFGHAPQLDEVIAYAIGSKRTVTAMKKAGVAQIELKKVSPPAGVLVWVCPPKVLRRRGR
jgi:phosphohistidine phosphatase